MLTVRSSHFNHFNFSKLGLLSNKLTNTVINIDCPVCITIYGVKFISKIMCVWTAVLLQVFQTMHCIVQNKRVAAGLCT